MDLYNDIVKKNKKDKNIIDIINLNFFIKEKCILKNINISFEKGKLHALIGPNGSGKSTLLKNISRIWKSSSGNIFIEGKEIKKYTRRDLSKKISYLPQEINVTFPTLVEDIVSLGRYPYLKKFQNLSKEDKKIIKESMEKVEVYKLRKKFITELSGGEKQRVWIAASLCTKASIILLDEPISFLDIYHKLKILNLIKKLKEEDKLTIIASIHELNYVYEYFDTTTILNHGRIFASGSTHNILNSNNIKKIFNVNSIKMSLNNDKETLYFSL